MRTTESRNPALAASVAGIVGLASLAWALWANWRNAGTVLPDFSGSWLSSQHATATPAEAAYYIWLVLFAALAGYLVWQWLPRNRARRLQALIRPWATASILLGVLWLQLFGRNLPGLGLVVMVALAVVLVKLARLISISLLPTAVDRWVIRATFGIYCGWILFATISNATVWLGSLDFEPLDNLLGTISALLVLLTGLGIGALTFLNPMGIYVNAGALWAVSWVVVARFSGPLYSTPMALCSGIAAALMLICLLASLRRRLPKLLRELFSRPAKP